VDKNSATDNITAPSRSIARTHFLDVSVRLKPRKGFLRTIDGFDKATARVVTEVLLNNDVRIDNFEAGTTHPKGGFRQTEVYVSGHVVCTADQAWLISQQILNGLAELDRERLHSWSANMRTPRHDH
jgi:hypothetical protein